MNVYGISKSIGRVAPIFSGAVFKGLMEGKHFTVLYLAALALLLGEK